MFEVTEVFKPLQDQAQISCEVIAKGKGFYFTRKKC